MKDFKIEDVPEDVLWVWNLEMVGHPVGLSTLLKAKAIAEKYPEWFDKEKSNKSDLTN